MKNILKKDTYTLIDHNLCDGQELMKDINDSTVAAAFLDPQYRGIFHFRGL